MDRNVKGLLGEKLGMTQVWDESNKVVPVTVIKAGPNVVTTVRTPEKDGYSAVQLAFGEIDPRKVNKPEQGHFAKAALERGLENISEVAEVAELAGLKASVEGQTVKLFTPST